MNRIILGRLGGDVFAVLLPDLADTVQAGIVARRFVETLIMPVRVDGQEIFVRHEACNDGMSDNRYPYSAVALISGLDMIAGCCRPAGPR